MVSISHAATLDIRSGQLFGAVGVDVDGVLYDVAFRDGTCIELYGGADENKDFPFTNLSNLNDTSLEITANKALLDQVFVDSPLGAFDSVPNLTNGCLSPGGCYVYTPMWVNSIGSVGVVGVINKKQGGGDIYTLQTALHRTFDTGWWSGDLAKYDHTVYAVWGKRLHPSLFLVQFGYLVPVLLVS